MAERNWVQYAAERLLIREHSIAASVLVGVETKA